MGSVYGHHIERIRPTELPGLESHVYLDSSGLPAVPRSVLDAVHRRLVDGCMIANPHSASPSGMQTRAEMDEVRSLVCRELFGLERRGGRVEACDPGWELVFTCGTTASLQSVAQSFDFQTYGRFAYLEQSHSSLLGLRDVVMERGAQGYDVLGEGEAVEWVRRQSRAGGTSLLALPLQCNATGKRYNKLVSAILKARQEAECNQSQRKVYLLLDVASYLSPSSNLPLQSQSSDMPDFVCFSFLKILGYPSGLGGLLLLRQAGAVLLKGKRYHGGGSLEAVTSRRHWKRPAQEIHEALEDGTPNLFGIVAVKSALETLRSDKLLGGWDEASAHVDALTGQLWSTLEALKHADGSPMVELYSEQAQEWSPESNFPMPRRSQGPILLFNVLRSASRDGTSRVDPAEVDRLACVENIHLRAGRMCNIGAITSALQLDERDVEALWERGVGCTSGGVQGRRQNDHSDQPSKASTSTESFEQERLLGLVSGCLRASLSAWNTMADLDQLSRFLVKYFCDDDVGDEGSEYGSCGEGSDCETASCDDGDSRDTSATSLSEHGRDEDSDHFLKELHLYPIKSCAYQPLTSAWNLTATGLEHDRQFCIVDIGNGKVMSQKQVPKMARIRPRVCLESRTMRVTLTGEDGSEQTRFDVPLDGSEPDAGLETGRGYDMCGKTLRPVLFSEEDIRTLLSAFLARDCTLARYPAHTAPVEQDKTPLLFSNESPFLLISSESVQQVCRWIGDDEMGGSADEHLVGLAFRSNFIVAARASTTSAAFIEERATRIKIGPHSFAVMGPCRRCQMIALDQTTGSPAPRVLSAVARHCRCRDGKLKGRLLFGIHLLWRSQWTPHSLGVTVKAGMPVDMR